jgi:hypothetical protein
VNELWQGIDLVVAASALNDAEHHQVSSSPSHMSSPFPVVISNACVFSTVIDCFENVCTHLI